MQFFQQGTPTKENSESEEITSEEVGVAKSQYELIMNDILPNALMIGVEYNLFWDLNPRELQPFIKAFSIKNKENDVLAWSIGLYTRYSILSALNKDVKYPKRPLSLGECIDEPMSEEEIKAKMFQQMKVINARFEG